MFCAAAASGACCLVTAMGKQKHWREGLGLTLCLVRCL